MSLFELNFLQMILQTEASKLMYNWSFLCLVLHKPTLLPSTFKCRKEIHTLCKHSEREISIPIFLLLYTDNENEKWSQIKTHNS